VVNAADEGWEEDPAYDRFDLGTYIGGRVELDGELYGTLCFADTDERNEAFTDTQRTFVELLTRWVSYELERQRARAQLQRERDRLEEFASVVSHDLRNPLTVANGKLEQARAERDGEHLADVADALERMEAIVEDVLTMARQGHDVGEADRDLVDLGSTIESCWATVATGDAALEVETDAAIRADADRLRRALENLFRNAVEHGTPEVIEVGDLEDGFYVADDGPGIPTSERGSIFEPGHSSSANGTGFGLAIVRGIVQAHGWSIEATESDAGGARFEISGVDRLE
jgi:signal transduction histidine kinase